MIVLDVAFLIVLLVVFPLVGKVQFPGIMRRIALGEEGARLRAYRGTMLWQWSLLAAGLIVWIAAGRDLQDLGVRAPGGLGFWIAAAVAAVAMIGLGAQLRSVRRDERARAEARSQLGGAMVFLPRTGSEVRGFAALSVTAGICEELLHRGWFLAFFAPLLGMPGAIALGVLLFGAAHSYGGRAVALKAGGMGLVFALLYVLSGSLWVPIALHVFVDWSSGLLSAAAHAGATPPAGGGPAPAHGTPGPESP